MYIFRVHKFFFVWQSNQTKVFVSASCRDGLSNKLDSTGRGLAYEHTWALVRSFGTNTYFRYKLFYFHFYFSRKLRHACFSGTYFYFGFIFTVGCTNLYNCGRILRTRGKGKFVFYANWVFNAWCSLGKTFSVWTKSQTKHSFCLFVCSRIETKIAMFALRKKSTQTPWTLTNKANIQAMRLGHFFSHASQQEMEKRNDNHESATFIFSQMVLSFFQAANEFLFLSWRDLSSDTE